MAKRTEWPSYYPPEVPPVDSVPAEGRAFRIVSVFPPSADDFRSTHEENPTRSYGDVFWMACGTSLHAGLAGAQRTRERYKFLREKKIAAGTLVATMGHMKPTPTRWSSVHITVWFKRSATPHRFFTQDGEAP
jgi:hypothetical protein